MNDPNDVGFVGMSEEIYEIAKRDGKRFVITASPYIYFPPHESEKTERRKLTPSSHKRFGDLIRLYDGIDIYQTDKPGIFVLIFPKRGHFVIRGSELIQ